MCICGRHRDIKLIDKMLRASLIYIGSYILVLKIEYLYKHSVYIKYVKYTKSHIAI